MNHLDLFSGLGGFAVAVHMLGHRTIGFCDNDNAAQELLSLRWPEVPIHDDIKTLTGNIVRRWGGCDLITGGFPCQPHSVAGKRRGASDDRHLWPEMARLVDECRPRYVVGENVPGIISLELDTCISDLESIGYTAWPVVVPAVAVDAPHRRDRVWIVADSMCDRGEARIPGPVAREEGHAGITDHGGRAVGDGSNATPERGCRWEAEPGVGRVVTRLPRRVDRLRLLGNSIVPVVAYEILRVMLAEEATP